MYRKNTALSILTFFSAVSAVFPQTEPVQPEVVEIRPSDRRIRQEKRNGKYGFVTGAGQTVISFSYESIDGLYSDFMAARKDGKFGAIDQMERVLIPFEYDDMRIQWQQPGVAVAKKAGKYGLLDRHGAQIVPFEYDFLSIEPQHPGIVYVLKDGQYGCFDPQGKLIIPFVYKGMFPFGDSIIRISCDNMRFGLISITGTALVDCQYTRLVVPDEKGPFLEARTPEGTGMIDYRGRVVVPFEYDAVQPLPFGFFCVEKGTKKGVADAGNRLVVPIEYLNIGAKRFMSCTVTADDTHWQASAYTPVYAPYWAVLTPDARKWGLLDTAGREILSPGFDAIELAGVKGPFMVRTGRNWALYNSKGLALTPPEFTKLGIFTEKPSLILATAGTPERERKGLLDHEGRVIFPAEYEAIQLLTSGCFSCRKDGLWGLYAPDGHALVPHRYRSIQAVPRAQVTGWQKKQQLKPGQVIVAEAISADTGATEYIDDQGRVLDLH